jgi:hypothetical protein
MLHLTNTAFRLLLFGKIKGKHNMDLNKFLDEICTCEMCNNGFVSEVNEMVK